MSYSDWLKNKIVYGSDILTANSFSGLPDPTTTGNSVIQLGDNILYSNGAAWFDVAGNIYFNKLPGFILIGDSTSALGNSSGTVTAITAAVGDLVATATRASHGLSKGAVFIMQGANESEFNGLFSVASVVSANQFTYTLNTPATVITATGSIALTAQQIVKDSCHVNRANNFFGANALYLGNFAQGGSKTDKLDSQLNYAINSTLNLYGRRCDIIICSSGINDAINDIPISTTQANIMSLISRCYSEKRLLVLYTQFPLSNTHASWTVARVEASRQYNTWLRELSKTDKRFVLFDANSVCLDTADQFGNWKSGYSLDGIHPSKLAASAIQTTLGANFFSKLKSANDLIVTQKFANPTLSGIGGAKLGAGVSGDVADGYTINSAATVVASKGISLDGKTESQRIVLTAGLALDNAEFYIDMLASCTVGKKYIVEATIRCEDVSIIRDLNLFLNTIIDGTSVLYGTMSAFENSALGGPGGVFNLRTPPLILQSGCTRFRPFIRVRAFSAGTITIDISDFYLYEL